MIYDYAFEHCENLKTFKFNEGLERIESFAFSHCGLTEIITPKTLKTVRAHAFEYCTSLNRVILNEGLEELGNERMDYRADKNIFLSSSIKELMLPSTIKNMSPATFRSCTLPEVIYVAPGFSFDLKKVTSVPAVTANYEDIMLGDVRISDWKKLQKVVLPEGLEQIGNMWFKNSTIESVVVPRSVKVIGSLAFMNCEKLATVSFHSRSALAEIGERAFEASGLTKFKAPSSLRRILRYAFSQCRELTDVKLNKGLELLGQEAFS